MLRTVAAVVDEGRFHTPQIRPAFKEELGRRLQEDFLRLFNADVDGNGNGNGGEPASRHRATSPWRRRLLGGGVAVGVLSGGLGGMAWAASGALPGDPLYGVKRSLENMRVSVSGSDLERGDQYLGQAKTRLGEIRHLLGRHDANVDGSDTSHLIADTMDNLSRDVDNAGQLLAPLAEQGNTEALASLQDFLATYEPQVHDLEVLLAPESQDKAQRLVTLMQSLDARVTAARAAIERARSAQTHPNGALGTGTHRAAAAPSATPTGPPSAGTVGQQHAATAQTDGAAPANPGAPSASPDTSLSLQVPLGSPATTFLLPPLLTGLPPIGITLGNTAPATGPTTDAGPPPTDPNPN